MFPLLTGAVTGGLGLLGSMFSSDTSAQNTQQNIQAEENMQQQTESFNAEQSQVARDYDTQMSSTAYQRASADMKAAGLNPMMMFGSGSAASTPSSPAPSVGTPNMAFANKQSPFAGLGAAADRAVSSAVAAKTYDKMTDEIANLKLQGNLIGAEAQNVGQRTETEKQRTLLTANEAGLSGFRLPSARFSAKQGEDLLSMPDWLRQAVTVGGFTGKGVSDTLSPVTDLISGARGVRSLLPSKSTSETVHNDGSESFNTRWDNLWR